MEITLEGMPQGLEIKQFNKKPVHFSDSETNVVLYSSYFMATSEWSLEE